MSAQHPSPVAAAASRRRLRLDRLANGPLPAPNRREHRRRHWIQAGVAMALVLAAASVAIWFAAADTAAKTGPWFGGYVDVTVQPGYDFGAPPDDAHKNVVLAFVVADPANPCAPRWGSEYSLDDAQKALGLQTRIEALRSQGGDAAVSFGGSVNTELANACTDPGALLAAYRAVVVRYGLKTVDFDVEATNLTDLDASARRAAAVASLQRERAAAGHPLGVWLTLPVSPRGLTDEGTTAVSAMVEAGVDLAGVNLMTMNYGASRNPGQTMAQASEAAATAAQSQLSIIYQRLGQSLDTPAVWRKIGLTPMVGANDVPGDVFGLDAAAELHAFAVEHGVGRVSMWSLNRDGPCPAGQGTTGQNATGQSTTNQNGTGQGASHVCSSVLDPAGAFTGVLAEGFHGSLR